MKHWRVITPEYGVMVPILDDGTGPMEYQRDVVCVDAPNKRAALVAGLRALRLHHSDGWICDLDGSPFAGLIVESANCPHGKQQCDCEYEECEECERIDEAASTEYECRRGEYERGDFCVACGDDLVSFGVERCPDTADGCHQPHTGPVPPMRCYHCETVHAVDALCASPQQESTP